MSWQTAQTLSRVDRAVIRRSASTTALSLSLLLAIAGCSSDSDGVKLTLTSPEAGQVLTVAEDDTDPDRSGLQFDVLGTSRGIAKDTPINLLIDGDEQMASASIDENGDVSFENVTLPPGTHRIQLETSTGSVASAEDHEYTLKALVITSPKNDDELSMRDDDDPARNGVQISVSVTAFAIDSKDDIVLLVDGSRVGAEPADSQGEAVFEGVSLSNGRHTLKATIEEDGTTIESSEVTVEVRQSCASVRFLSPVPPNDDEDRVSLGGDECPDPMSGDPFTTRIEISTDAGDGRPVQLFVNGQPVEAATVDGAVATFDDVVLSERTRANTIEVEVENSEGIRCRQAFPGEVFVDCAGASCTLKSPTPVSYIDDEDDLSLFLNRALRGDDGYTIEVATDEELDGQEIQLVIDGNTRRALKQKASASGDDAIATFEAVDLDEGAHTLEALCTDASGNVTSTGTFTWIVDTTACELDLTDPVADTLFVPADDEDNASDGTQIVVTSTVTGSDCVRQRAAVCDPSEGIKGVDFAAHDGSGTLLSTITLDEDSTEQTLCVEIEDRAGNAAADDVSVVYRGDAPRLLIETPEDGTKYNAAGGNGYVADADPSGSPTACDAEFSILCSELGAEVELRHDDASGHVFATAECEEPAAGDDLPDGYAGRARLTAVFEDDDLDQTMVIVATQTVGGASSPLVGRSQIITLQGDCRRPTASFSRNPCNAPTNQLSVGQASARDFTVLDTTMDIDEIELTVTYADDDTATVDPSGKTAGTAEFSDVDLTVGGEGDVTIAAVVTDDFGNSAMVECTVLVDSAVPEILSWTPADNAVFGLPAACDPGGGQFGVLLNGTIDQATDRTVSIEVNGTAVLTNVAVVASGSDGAINNVCVPVPDNAAHGGPSMLALRVANTLNLARVVAEVRTINVVSAPPTNGIVIDDLPPPDPADEMRRERVVAEWPKPTEQWPGQLVDYELRCGTYALAQGASMGEQTSWLTRSEVVALPADLTPDDDNPSVELQFRVEDPRHCVIRARDIAGQFTPIVETTDLTVRLIQQVIAVGTTNHSLGYRVAAVGDVDDDGIDDVLIGGLGRAELIFGTTDALESAPRVVFTGSPGTAGVGRSVIGLGDFNGDDLNDFAIGNPAANGNAGKISIFFGRPRAQWPTGAVDIETVCNADLCLEGTGTLQVGRWAVSGGNFDGDTEGLGDLVIGLPTVNQLLVVLGHDYENRPCTACRSGESCVANVCARDTAPGAGEPAFWRLRYSVPSGDPLDPAGADDLIGFQVSGPAATNFGISAASLGAFDGATGDDLAIGATAAKQVHYLSGQPHDGSGVDPLAATALGLIDSGTGMPDGMPISAQAPTNYGIVMANIGDFLAPTGSTADATDLAVAGANSNQMFVVPGDPVASNDPGFSAPNVQVSALGELGQSIGTADDPLLGLLGDLDGDGKPELLTGTRTSIPHDVLLWYPDRLAAAVAGGGVDRASAGVIPLANVTSAGGSELAAQFIGDLNDDGYLDIVVGEFRADTNQGQAILLY